MYYSCSMVKIQQMSDDDARYVIEHKEFSKDILNAGKYVAVVPTQSWCHQWHDMRVWLQKPSAAGTDVAVFYYEYDTTDLFDPFREFKESHWQNDQVPYVRYYRDGVCVQQSNYCSEADFYGNFDA